MKSILSFLCLMTVFDDVVQSKQGNEICYNSYDDMMTEMMWKGLLSFRKNSNNVKCDNDERKGGTTYIQWGRSTCTNKGADLVYAGYVGGTAYTIKGAAVNKLCLPKEPQWDLYDDKVNSNPSIGGTVFDINDTHIPNTLFDSKYKYQGITCSVCHIDHASSTIMIPGRKECIGKWNVEYTWYLFAGYPGLEAASEYVCIDGTPDYVVGKSDWTGKSILYPVHASCNEALPCPPYVNGREMTCVVCSR